MTTTDFSDFGQRERQLAEELLHAWNEDGLPHDFDADEVVIMMNKNSGNVFLTNSDYQVAMMNGDDLESFYSCPICGHEGFYDEMEHGEGGGDTEECLEYLEQIKPVQPAGEFFAG